MSDPTVPPIDWPAILSSVATLAAGVGLWLQQRATRRELRENTAATEEAQTAARSAEQTSNGRLSEQIKLNQSLQAENYHLRRLLDALEMDQAGLSALSTARARLETLRAMRPGSGRGDHEPTT